MVLDSKPAAVVNSPAIRSTLIFPPRRVRRRRRNCKRWRTPQRSSFSTMVRGHVGNERTYVDVVDNAEGETPHNLPHLWISLHNRPIIVK